MRVHLLHGMLVHDRGGHELLGLRAAADSLWAAGGYYNVSNGKTDLVEHSIKSLQASITTK